MITLRPYQEEVKAAVYDHLRTRDDNPCAVVPTAGGKTPIMASICKDAVGQWDGRVLILAHVKELLEQTRKGVRNRKAIFVETVPDTFSPPRGALNSAALMKVRPQFLLLDDLPRLRLRFARQFPFQLIQPGSVGCRHSIAQRFK